MWYNFFKAHRARRIKSAYEPSCFARFLAPRECQDLIFNLIFFFNFMLVFFLLLNIRLQFAFNVSIS